MLHTSVSARSVTEMIKEYENIKLKYDGESNNAYIRLKFTKLIQDFKENACSIESFCSISVQYKNN